MIKASNDSRFGKSMPLVSLVVPAYNEASLLVENLQVLCNYMHTLEDRFRWELLVVNDGSQDETGKLADRFAEDRPHVRVLHHRINYQLGQVLRFAFGQCRGDYIVTYDIDLSYAPEHIGRLLDTLVRTNAKIVIASPYVEEGKVTAVPWFRKALSHAANQYLSLTTRGLNPAGTLSTITGLVRAYDARFLRSLNLKAMGVQINSEIIQKALVLRAHIEEIPAHLDWSAQREKEGRSSSLRLISSLMNYLVFGYMFRPFVFFLLPAALLFLLAAYAFFWVTLHTISYYLGEPVQVAEPGFLLDISEAVGQAYAASPHAFLIGGVALILAIQVGGLGILSLQSKRYFDELFSLGTAIYRTQLSGIQKRDEEPKGVLNDERDSS